MRSVIFLGIEGVLVSDTPKPTSSCQGLAQELALMHHNPHIAELSDELCAQVLAYFNPEACARINRLCMEKDAKIVISSTLRLIHSLPTIQAIFQIAGIHYVDDVLPALAVRKDAIAQYVRQHNVSAYVVLDKMDLAKSFGYRFIRCRSGFMDRQFDAAASALKCQIRKTANTTAALFCAAAA